LLIDKPESILPGFVLACHGVHGQSWPPMTHPLNEPWWNPIDALNLIVTCDLDVVDKERLEWDGRNYLEHPAAIRLFSDAKSEYIEEWSWLQQKLREGKIALSARKGYKTSREIVSPLQLVDLRLHVTSERLQLVDVDTLQVTEGQAEWRDPLVCREDLFDALAQRHGRPHAFLVPALWAPPAPLSKAREPEPEQPEPVSEPDPKPEQKPKPELTSEALVAFLRDTFAPPPRSNRETRRRRATDHFGDIPHKLWLAADEVAGVKGSGGAPSRNPRK
jgi:hypothetical protein